MKAIGWYLETHTSLRLQLSTPPKVYFKDKTNKISSKHISEITKEHEQAKDEDSKERARERRQKKV
jgi:hypothetical protein